MWERDLWSLKGGVWECDLWSTLKPEGEGGVGINQGVNRKRREGDSIATIMTIMTIAGTVWKASSQMR